MEVLDKVRELGSNLLKDREIELVDLTYRREGSDMILRLIVDKKGGITVDECGWVNEALGELLDKEDIISERYILEVSSPGLDRPLKTRKDFERVVGKVVIINTYGPIEEKREHIGKVVSCSEEAVTIELWDNKLMRTIPLDNISKAQLKIEFLEGK